MSQLGQKAIDCLEVASFRVGSPQRYRRLSLAADRWSWKALNKKMDELVDRGYIEALRGGTASGALTRKGREALAAGGGIDACGAGDDVVGTRLREAAARMRQEQP